MLTICPDDVVLYFKKSVTDQSQCPVIFKSVVISSFSEHSGHDKWLQVFWMNVSSMIYSVGWQTMAHKPNLAQQHFIFVNKVLFKLSHAHSLT